MFSPCSLTEPTSIAPFMIRRSSPSPFSSHAIRSPRCCRASALPLQKFTLQVKLPNHRATDELGNAMSADQLLDGASRLIVVATRCAWSFGAADGLNDILTSRPDPHGEWRQPVSVLNRDALLMAALRVS